ncbi:endolytic transglycosylase MltG [Thermosyntropha sp.]|uniref:endolytic transglycosylase MltG n=1 Tax=Thermosyntropha sp. TaxID=2740820 RepID=UPI0025E90E33|nr:endolytic transglycosylase MltG [Thermosyntropha sp.]
MKQVSPKKGTLILILAVLLTGCISGYFYWLKLQYMPVDLNDKRYIDIYIPENSTARDIAKILSDNNLIRSEKAFLYYCKKTGYDAKLQAGHFRFSRSQSLKEIVQDIAEGKTVFISFTVPEGYTVEQIGQLLAEKGICRKEDWDEAVRKEYNYEFLKDVPQGVKNPLEGFLFPDTYQVDENVTAEKIVDLMLANFDKVFRENFASELENHSIYEIITIASMIEREAAIPEERKRISGVIANRLKKGMPLQVDATVLYALGKHKEVVTRKDLKIDSPYNTYKISGLPIGPIACPGKEAIRAALNPEKHDYLYYVARGDGSHYFSKTHEEHLQAIKRYQKP